MSEALLTVMVEKKTFVAERICVLEMVDPLGNALPDFSAGSHIDLHIRRNLIRQYSLCNNPKERSRYVIGVLRENQSRGGSLAVHEDINVGDFIIIGRPRNKFALVPGARKSILFAGGIGITPILAMAEELANSAAEFEVHYACRSRERAAFLEQIARSSYADRVRYYFDNEDSVVDLPTVLGRPAPDDHVFVCGPQPFIEWVSNEATAQGWSNDNVHFELFASDFVPNAANETPFEVRLRKSGGSFIVPPGESIAQALAGHGVIIPTACEQGMCGTCLTGVCDGIPLHRDQYLTEDEKSRNNCLLACCSRAKSDVLVLDL